MNTRGGVSRLDYKILHTTGKKIGKEFSPATPNQMEEENFKPDSNDVMFGNQLNVTLSTLSDDIDDFIDENNPKQGHLSVADIDEIINKITQYRTMYRTKIKELQNISADPEIEKKLQEKLRQIKDFINAVKSARKKSMKVISFLISDSLECMNIIEAMIKKDLSKEKDEVILQAKTNKTEINRSMEKLSKQITDILKLPNCGKDIEIDRIRNRYEVLCTKKATFIHEVEQELASREIEKCKLFKESMLNIKLQKFKGYSSSIDIYTFQSLFEKLHFRSTPRRLLSDLLKNNYLDEPALSLVKGEENIEEIWKRLKQAFGDVKIMLSKKISSLHNLEMIWKLKDDSKIAESLSRIISIIKDLLELSKKHNIQEKLFHGDALQKVYKLIGDKRVTKWLDISCEENLEGEDLWLQLTTFLEKELKVQQQKILISGVPDNNQIKTKFTDHHHPIKKLNAHVTKQKVSDENYLLPINNNCAICGAYDHVSTNGPNGTKLIQYYTCKKFTEMTPHNRFLELRKKNLCYQCLFPGAESSTGKHRDGRCQRDFICPHESHDKYTLKKHVLLCEEHKNNPQNEELLQQYKTRFILRSTDLPDFSKNISLVLHSFNTTNQLPLKNHQSSTTVTESGIYQMQQILVNNEPFLIFFDSGCSDFVVRDNAIKRLGENSRLEYSGQVKLGGIGDVITKSSKGIYSVKIPTYNNQIALFTGACLPNITTTFPKYPLDGQVQLDIFKAYRQQGGDINNLPKLPSSVGGDVDMMIGIKYLRYHPEPIFQLPSGLTIYKSIFKNADGSRGVIGGPHHIFTLIEKQYTKSKSKHIFLTNQFHIYKSGFQIDPDASILGYKNNPYQIDVINSESYIKYETIFNDVENAGSEISYRCIKCRTCTDCKDHDSTLAISIREEIEQDLINKSVSVDIENQVTIATLPFIQDPELRLQPNRHKALKVYHQQTKRLSKTIKDKQDVIESERKLQQLGHVEFVKNLSPQLQQILQSSSIRNFIPWRAVWKVNSISTPCRIVFDASQLTDTGFSLNSILAKGTNGMNKLVEILIRWYTYKIAFHTDIRKMYNSIQLKEEHWCFQRYLWENTLDVAKPPEEKVIKTLIYGVKSSGNQAERGLRQTSGDANSGRNGISAQ